MLISRLLTTSLSTVFIARNIVNLLDGLSLHYESNYNYFIFVNIMYINGSPILHIIDKATRF